MLDKFHYWLSGVTERRVLVIAAVLLLLPMFKPGLSSTLEDVTMRAAVKFDRGDIADTGIVIAAIDQRAFNTYGPWPGPASAVTQAADRIVEMNPRLIVVDDRSDKNRFDLLFALPKLRGSSGTVIGYSFYEGLSDLPAGYADKTGGKPPAEAAQLAMPATPADDYELPSMSGIDLDAVKGAERRDAEDGCDNTFEDSDGVVRSQPLAVRLGHRAYPALALAAAARTRGFTPIIVENAQGKPDSIALGEERISISPDARTGISFRGPAGTFPSVSVVDVVAGNVKGDELKDKTVLLGFTDPDIAQMLKTPFGPMPAVEVLANTLAGLMEHKRSILLHGIVWSAVVMLFVLAIYALGIVRLKLPMRFVWTTVVVLIAWTVAVVVYRVTGILIPAAQFTIFAVALLIVSAVWRIFVIEVPRRFRMRTFHMRIAPEELEKAVRRPGSVIAKGVTRDVIALAFDIRGYAAIASTHGQEDMCALMREYRTIVARILLKHGAFIDSWSGDECRAAFGAIMPGGSYELDACRAAFEVVRTFTRIREQVKKRFAIDRLRFGVGITAGRAGVGSLGPRGVADIGITGEAMERALTLRALNKTYRTSIIVDGTVREAAENSFSFRALDPIAVPGTERIVHVHELLGKAGIILPHLEKYLEAREAYLRGSFERAIHLFSLILAEHPHDGPSLVFLKRSKVLAISPPEADWRGIWKG
jgi:adenylate cyclase